MAASVNNIAATFAASRSSSSSSSSSSSLPPSTSSLVAAWNPHSSLPRSHRSSLLTTYGLPGPIRPLCGPHSPLRGPHHHHPIIPLGSRLPNCPLSFLGTDHLTIQTTTLPDLTRGRKSVILSATAAFAPPPLSGGARQLVSKAGLMRSKGADVIALVAANDVHVMRAWGESLGADKAGLMMLSDPDAELANALGTAIDMRGGAEGLGVRSESFCMVAVNGVVKKALFVDQSCDFDEVIRAL